MSDDMLVRAVRRACAVTLVNWATVDAISSELAKEDFVRDIGTRLDSARVSRRVECAGVGADKRWRPRP